MTDSRLRRVTMTVARDGSMTVEIDGVPLAPGEPAWSRESYGAVIDQVTGFRRAPARVEVREADGSVFVHELLAARSRTAASSDRLQRGFLPGEDVAVAPIVQHTTADDGGAVQARPSSIAGDVEVVLVGRLSGTFAILAR